MNFPQQHRKMVQDAVGGLHLHHSAEILELACGTGETIELLAEWIDTPYSSGISRIRCTKNT